MFYHGVRAYFTGSYTRIGNLDAKERKAVLEGGHLYNDGDGNLKK